jgi:four helix bundle protein
MRNYRDLLVWEKAHSLTLCIYRETQTFPKEERFGITSQIRRAASSIAANLAEGCGRRSDGEMARFTQIAMGSAAEVSYHLLLCRDLGLLGAEEFNRLASATDEIMRMLSALAARLKSPGSRGVLELRAKS